MEQAVKLAKVDVDIYALRDPLTRKIRYVGASWIVKGRYLDDIYMQNRATAPWVGELRARGLRPKLVILETVNGIYAKDAEVKWLRRYAKYGNLLNKIIDKSSFGVRKWARPDP